MQPTEPIPIEYAITLRRPWAHAIAHMGKDIENRTWNCSLKPGTWLAIHAGRGYEFDGEDWLRETFPEHELPEAAQQPTGIVAIAQFCGNVTQSQSVWFGGPVGWQLEQVRALPQAVQQQVRQALAGVAIA